MSNHRHVGCPSRGKRLECWRCVLRFKFGWAYLEKKPQMYLFWPYYWKGQIRVRFGLFLLIHSPKLKSEHTAPTFQPLASGLTPHMPMFGHHEIFTFWWEGKILKWKSTQLTVKNFVKKNYIPFLIYERQPNQVQPQFFGDSILFHHYLVHGYKVGQLTCELFGKYFACWQTWSALSTQQAYPTEEKSAQGLSFFFLVPPVIAVKIVRLCQKIYLDHLFSRDPAPPPPSSTSCISCEDCMIFFRRYL